MMRVGEIQRATDWMISALMKMPNSMTRMTCPWPSCFADVKSAQIMMTTTEHSRTPGVKTKPLAALDTKTKMLADAPVRLDHAGQGNIESIPSQPKLMAVESSLFAACGVSSVRSWAASIASERILTHGLPGVFVPGTLLNNARRSVAATRVCTSICMSYTLDLSLSLSSSRAETRQEG